LNKAIGSTPSKVFFGFEQRFKDNDNLRSIIDTVLDNETDFESNRSEARDYAQLVNRTLQEYNKRQYDSKHKRT